MRGKKADLDFLSEFISQCIQLGMDSPDDFAKRAQSMIEEIDEEIRRVEKQKVLRSKLLDVVLAFKEDNKNNRQEEAKILSFFQIQHPNICKFICDQLKDNVVTIEELLKRGKAGPDILFCIKQLLEHKIISKSGSHLLRGEKFESYLKFIIKES